MGFYDYIIVSFFCFLQGPVSHRPQWCGEAHECERPASGPLRGGDPSPSQGLPVCGDPRRGVSRQLEARVSNGEWQLVKPSVSTPQDSDVLLVLPESTLVYLGCCIACLLIFTGVLLAETKPWQTSAESINRCTVMWLKCSSYKWFQAGRSWCVAGQQCLETKTLFYQRCRLRTWNA